MSRIGRKPIPIPAGVDIKIEEGNFVTVKGPKGQLSRKVSSDMQISIEGQELLVQRPSDGKLHRSMHGLTRTLVANMVIGVTDGYQKTLDIVGVGYRAALQGKKLVLALGYAHPVEFDPEADLEIEVPAPNKVIVKGIDKEKVGELAANIRSSRAPEPYKGKGIRYEGEVVRRKAGKAGARS